jgi:hypothetical protein
LPGRAFPRALAGRFGRLLVALIGLMLFAPLVIAHEWGIAALGLFSGAVLVAGLHAARASRETIVLGLVLALIDFTIGRLAMNWGTRGLLIVECLFWLVTLCYVTATILELILASRTITAETLLAALCVYLLIGLIGAFGFALIELTMPGSFQLDGGGALSWSEARSNASSFMALMSLSYATLSGAGTTEISPAHGFSVNAVSLEALIGQIYLAVIVARLVGVELEEDLDDSKRLTGPGA